MAGGSVSVSPVAAIAATAISSMAWLATGAWPLAVKKFVVGTDAARPTTMTTAQVLGVRTCLPRRGPGEARTATASSSASSEYAAPKPDSDVPNGWIVRKVQK